jgi:hypothetical protein
MVERQPSSEEWQELYGAARRVKDLAPWEWMEEPEVFGVEDPETGEVGFVSVMGLLGEHFAVSLYLGPEGLYAFWGFEEEGPGQSPENLFSLPHLQASFEDRNDLDSRDRKVIKELGLKFRGRKEWPMFRSYAPGLFPWFLEVGEARFLAHALDQLVEVAPRLVDDRSLFKPGGEEDYLVRVPRREGDALLWEDRVVSVPPPEPKTVEIRMEPQVLEELQRLPQGDHRLEMGFFMVPAPIQEKKADRPYFPYMLLTVDGESGMVLGTDMLVPETSSIEDMWGELVPMAALQLVGLGSRPAEVAVDSPELHGLLQPLAEATGFELNGYESLPTLQFLKMSLTQNLG